jgi:dipeptidyl aminopeptidase/acylaminoacyl peptidase
MDRSRVQRLVMMDKRLGNPTKAKNADIIHFTQQTFAEFPDVWLADDLTFKNPRKVSTANPQQAEYNWGSSELVNWLSHDGIPLQGILIKPEDFDYRKQYPMIVYFYERSADTLHNYRAPAPSASIMNPTMFASQGYIVFIPDIVYKPGYPGESAMHSIMPGVHEVLRRGFVDPKRVGLDGQSWGGYQIAYMITETDMFAAAYSGAPVANMFSAYGGIRWGSGLVRQFQYERTQSRIGDTPWNMPLRYLENSPLFFLDKVKTPVLIMHNDKDGAVPWYQGIELFTGLRRLSKPSWLLVYNDEDHNLVQRRNRKDLSIRKQQFFDHYLKGEPMPIWMSQGIPATEKGRTMGFEPDPATRRSGG